MNQRALIAAAAASLLSTFLVASPALAQEKEKCYGIAEAGKNDCANLAGTHSCAGQSKLTNDAGEWKYVAKGTCAGMKGMTADAAKAKMKMSEKKS
jgi:uncharacterized membrane protein